MNLRRKVLLFSAATLVVFGLGAVLISRYGPEPRLMYCGHPKEFRFPLMPYAKTHCSSLRVISDLKTLYLAQRIHESETGTNATTLEELGEMFPASRIRYVVTLNAEGTNWSAHVPKQNSFAGHYLLTSAGRLHFTASHAATTNDYVLDDWSR